MENMENFEELLNGYMPTIEKGEVIKGKILKKDNEYGYLEIGSKGEAKVHANEIEDFKVGDEIEVKIVNIEDNDGYTRASRRAYELEVNIVKIEEAFNKQEIIEGKVERKVNGGYIVDLMSYKAFMPNSMTGHSVTEGKKAKMIIKEIKDGKVKKIIVSSKEVEAKISSEKLQSFKVGDIVEGTVKEVLEFGLTLNVNEINGFVHVSELDWKKVDKIADKYKAGDIVKAKIISIDNEKRSLKLSIKQLKDDPWVKAAEKYSEGKEVTVKVLRTVNFGAFVELEPGVEGLIHISDFSWGKKVNINDFMKPGDELTAVILSVNTEEKKIRVGVKQLKKDPWENAEEKYKAGNIVEAKVVEVKEFGIFAEVEEGVDIFVHVSDLKWERAETSIYKAGDVIKAKILEMDKENKKIKGSIKNLEKSPWEKIGDNYKIGERLKRKIESITNFGLFIEVENGIDGMIHISQASSDYIKNLEEKYKVGDEIEAEIIEIDSENKKIKLSIKKIEKEAADKENKELIEKYGTAE